jgi:hypothetical protein
MVRSARIERELKRLVDAITQGVAINTVVPRIMELEADRTTVAAEADSVIALHPTAIDRYSRDVAALVVALETKDAAIMRVFMTASVS